MSAADMVDICYISTNLETIHRAYPVEFVNTTLTMLQESFE